MSITCFCPEEFRVLIHVYVNLTYNSKCSLYRVWPKYRYNGITLGGGVLRENDRKDSGRICSWYLALTVDMILTSTFKVKGNFFNVIIFFWRRKWKEVTQMWLSDPTFDLGVVFQLEWLELPCLAFSGLDRFALFYPYSAVLVLLPHPVSMTLRFSYKIGATYWKVTFEQNHSTLLKNWQIIGFVAVKPSSSNKSVIHT